MSKLQSMNRCDGVSRRDAIRVGGLSALGFGLGDLFRYRRLFAEVTADAGGKAKSKAKSCILVWLDGGPSHLETFDPKPDAPVEVRGPLASIATSVPGLHFSECLPQLAKRAHQLTIVRSMTSPLGEHNFGTHYLMTGYRPTPALEYPTYGSVVAHLRRNNTVLPPHIAVPNFRVGGSNLSGNGYLPARTKPFAVGGDPAKPEFAVRDLDLYRGLELDRLQRRRGFVEALNRFSEQAEAGQVSNDSDLEEAFRLLSSKDAKQAFDLSREPDKIRKRYGPRTIGQSCLLARRLIERGVPFVTVTNPGWDTHENLMTRLKDGYTGARVPVGLVPNLDLAVAALIDDLTERGLIDETLVVVMGEFGRTPKLNTSGGRDHWPRVFSVMLAGGGVPSGLCLGSSDAIGEAPNARPITPSDLAATIYRLMDLDPQLELRTDDNRPIRLTPASAQPISEIVS